MSHRAFVLCISIVLLALALGGCTPTTTPGTAPPTESSQGVAPQPAPASGVEELGDGRIAVTGTLVYSDLEGGFYLVRGNDGETLYVLQPSAEGEYGADMRSLTGSRVRVTGETIDGASIRMAGPEMMVESVEAVDDAGAP